MLDAAKVKTYATAEAFALGHLRVADVPAPERARLVDAVAQELRAPRADVLAVLAAEWNETKGRAGGAVTGAGSVAPSSTAVRETAGRGAAHLHMQQLRAQTARASVPAPGAAAGKADVARRADAIDRALRGDGAAKVADEIPHDHLPLTLRRNVALDAKVVRPGLDGARDTPVRTGEYGAIVLSKLAADDPILDLPLYRGMGSADPAIHALRVTGQLIPGGVSNDYEGFKTYSHRAPLDAFEWTLDPFVALKGTGGHGYLLRTTLRELRDAGHRDVARKAGDTEGGLFIEGAVKPTVRELGHVPGAYVAGAALSSPADPQRERYAAALAKALREHGGYDALVEVEHKLARPLAHQGLTELRGQASFWAERVAELDKGGAVTARYRARLEAADAVADPAERRAALEALTADLKLRAATLAPPPRASDDLLSW